MFFGCKGCNFDIISFFDNWLNGGFQGDQCQLEVDTCVIGFFFCRFLFDMFIIDVDKNIKDKCILFTDDIIELIENRMDDRITI